jgi:hypothetical protein
LIILDPLLSLWNGTLFLEFVPFSSDFHLKCLIHLSILSPGSFCSSFSEQEGTDWTETEDVAFVVNGVQVDKTKMLRELHYLMKGKNVAQNVVIFVSCSVFSERSQRFKISDQIVHHWHEQ